MGNFASPPPSPQRFGEVSFSPLQAAVWQVWAWISLRATRTLRLLQRYFPSRRARFLLPLAAGFLPALALFLPTGCSFNAQPTLHMAGAPIIRVRLMSNIQAVSLTASEPPIYKTSFDPTLRLLNLPPNRAIAVRLADGVWQVGGTRLTAGTLTIVPTADGTVAVASGNSPNNGPYRGQYRLVPTGGDKFDVINDVDVDSYVAGVLPKELLADWQLETYKAQAIVARTYAIYEKQTSGAGREWDVYPDTRSQMYGGYAAETAKSRRAAAETAGIVVAYGPPGHEKIFKAYFSACCGGITQSAADAFGEPFIPPLGDQNNHAICNACPSFNWGPVVVRKDELTRRFRLWAGRSPTQRPECRMAALASIEIQQTNEWGRPVRFLVTDVQGKRYSLSGEELRWAVNCDAANDPARMLASTAGAVPPPPTVLKSSFCKVITDIDSIRFVEGHGWGHGVGMCQWTAEAQAEQGMHHERIIRAAYQQSTLVRAY